MLLKNRGPVPGSEGTCCVRLAATRSHPRLAFAAAAVESDIESLTETKLSEERPTPQAESDFWTGLTLAAKPPGVSPAAE